MIVQFEQDSQAIVQEETSSVELSPGQWLENVRKLPLDVQILTSSSVQGVNSAASLVDFLHREGDSFSEINQKRFLRASTTSRYTHCIVQIYSTQTDAIFRSYHLLTRAAVDDLGKRRVEPIKGEVLL